MHAKDIIKKARNTATITMIVFCHGGYSFPSSSTSLDVVVSPLDFSFEVDCVFWLPISASLARFARVTVAVISGT